MINSSQTVNYNPATKKPCHCSAAKQAACMSKLQIPIDTDPKEFFSRSSTSESEAVAPGVVSFPLPVVESANKPGEVVVSSQPSASAVGENAEPPPQWSASAPNPGVIAVLDQ